MALAEKETADARELDLELEGSAATGEPPAILPLKASAFLPMVRSGLRLLSGGEVKRAVLLTAAMVLVGLIELGAMASMLPFVRVVMQRDAVETTPWLLELQAWMGSPTPLAFVTWLGLGVIALTVLSTAALWLVEYAVQGYAAACQTRLAKDLLAGCIRASYEWFLVQNPTGLGRLIYEDTKIWSRGFVFRIMEGINQAVKVLAALVLVFIGFSWAGFWVAASAGLVLYGLFRVRRPIVLRLASTKRTAQDRMAQAVFQVLAGIKDIKISRRGAHFTRLFSVPFAAHSAAHAKVAMWSVVPPMLVLMVSQVALVTIALLFWHAGMTSGEIATQLALLVLVTTKAIPAANDLSSAFNSLLNSFPYVAEIQRLKAQLEAVGVDRRRRTPGRPLTDWRRIQCSQVGYRYPAASGWALDGLDLSIGRGRHYGIVGRSGAGKSTLIDLLTGLLEPTTGVVAIDGIPLQDLDLESWQRRLGYVPQTLFIIDDTLRANVAFGVPREEVDDAHVLECLRLANLGTLIEELGQGLDTSLGERGQRLSGGQRQRVGIARALYHRPELIIFDEATSSLDAESERAILASLDNLRGRVTLIIIAHRLTTVERCDHLFVLEDGRLAGQGTFAELRANHRIFQQVVAGLAAAPSGVTVESGVGHAA